jgi:hypothetical protein
MGAPVSTASASAPPPAGAEAAQSSPRLYVSSEMAVLESLIGGGAL